jgi:hypothetical protein
MRKLILLSGGLLVALKGGVAFAVFLLYTLILTFSRPREKELKKEVCKKRCHTL